MDHTSRSTSQQPTLSSNRRKKIKQPTITSGRPQGSEHLTLQHKSAWIFYKLRIVTEIAALNQISSEWSRLLLNSFVIIKLSYHQLQQLADEPREARRNISSARSAELIDRQNICKSSTSNLSRAKRGVIASCVLNVINGCKWNDGCLMCSVNWMLLLLHECE